jgi:glycosyltransferase involved in cell wall biosynthesis
MENTMNNKKILMVLEHTFPPDIRVEKEAKALLEAGFDLSLVCADDGKEENTWNGMKLFKVKWKKNIINRLKTRLLTIHDEFYKYIYNLLKKEEFDILHVHDLRLVPTVLKLKKHYDFKIIIDLHENYPAGVREWRKASSGLQGMLLKIFNGYEKWLSIEKDVVTKVDSIVAVVDEMKNRMIEQHNIPETKFTVVSNLEDIDFVDKAKTDETLLKKYKDKFVILYIGGFGVHRGIDAAIKGMKYIDKKNMLLLLVGRGSQHIEDEFRTLIKENNIEDKVEMLGWQPFEKVFTYQKLADICIVPHNSNEHTDNTIPHKIFQYMMVGKPIVVSSCPPLARVVKESNSGLVFKAGDEKDFAKKILKIYEDTNLQKELSSNGLTYTFNDNNTWQEESKKLIRLYETI